MNTRSISIAASLLLSVVLVAVPAAAQSTFGEAEFGYQWVDVSGNQDMYRTQLDERDGFVLNDLSLAVLDTDGTIGVFDQLRIDASGFGGSPTGRFRLTSDLDGAYSLRLSYLHFAYFSALPAFANPFADEGVIPGQHTLNRDRDIVDMELQILPGHAITPIVGYRWNRYDGPRQTTYHVGQNEFRLNSESEQTEKELRAGIAFHAGTFRGAVIQGWRDYSDRERLHLVPGGEQGNFPGPILGQEQLLDTLDRTVRTDADTPVTTVQVNGRFAGHGRVDLSYARADYDADTSVQESLTGSLVSYQILQYFQGLDDSVASHTSNPYWRGGLQVGWDFGDQLTVDVGYEKHHRELEGFTMISSLYLETMTFSGIDTGDVSRLVENRNRIERNDETVDVRVQVRDLGPLRLWANWATTDSDLDVSEGAAEIVLPDGQGGTFKRSVDRYGLGAEVGLGPLKLVLDGSWDDADKIVVRTDYLDRSRYRGRLGGNVTSWLDFTATAERIDWDNSGSGVAYDGKTTHYALDVGVHPVSPMTLRAAWDRYKTDTSILIRHPEDFTVAPSLYADDGEMWEGSIGWQKDRFGVTGGYSHFNNDGSFPFQLKRVFGRVFYDFTETFGLAVEYEDHRYREDLFSLADFDATRWGAFLRVKM